MQALRLEGHRDPSSRHYFQLPFLLMAIPPPYSQPLETLSWSQHFLPGVWRPLYQPSFSASLHRAQAWSCVLRWLLWPKGEWREQGWQGYWAHDNAFLWLKPGISKDFKPGRRVLGDAGHGIWTPSALLLCALSTGASPIGLPDLFCLWGTETKLDLFFSPFCLWNTWRSSLLWIMLTNFIFPIELLVGNFAHSYKKNFNEMISFYSWWMAATAETYFPFFGGE